MHSTTSHHTTSHHCHTNNPHTVVYSTEWSHTPSHSFSIINLCIVFVCVCIPVRSCLVLSYFLHSILLPRLFTGFDWSSNKYTGFVRGIGGGQFLFYAGGSHITQLSEEGEYRTQSPPTPLLIGVFPTPVWVRTIVEVFDSTRWGDERYYFWKDKEGQYEFSIKTDLNGHHGTTPTSFGVTSTPHDPSDVVTDANMWPGLCAVDWFYWWCVLYRPDILEEGGCEENQGVTDETVNAQGQYVPSTVCAVPQPSAWLEIGNATDIRHARLQRYPVFSVEENAVSRTRMLSSFLLSSETTPVRCDTVKERKF